MSVRLLCAQASISYDRLDEMVLCMADHRQDELRVAIAGLGSIGTKIAAELDRGIEGLVLSAIAAREPDKHRAFLSGLRRPPAILPIDQLAEVSDIIVDAYRVTLYAPSSSPR